MLLSYGDCQNKVVGTQIVIRSALKVCTRTVTQEIALELSFTYKYLKAFAYLGSI